jgi:TolA-binding protein
MSIPNEQTQTLPKTRDTDSALQAGIEIEMQAEFLLDEAREADAGQSSLIDSAPLGSQYTAALAAQVDAKHDQTERIEDRLENLIELQASRLQQVQVQQPGFLALPGTRQLWQQKLQQQQNTLQKLRGRLEAVREIKEGMGLHCPRIEELAAHKLRFKEPGMSSEWVNMPAPPSGAASTTRTRPEKTAPDKGRRTAAWPRDAPLPKFKAMMIRLC